jgi:hypothetical protein
MVLLVVEFRSFVIGRKDSPYQEKQNAQAQHDSRRDYLSFSTRYQSRSPFALDDWSVPRGRLLVADSNATLLGG